MTARDFDPDRATAAELRAELDRLQGEVEALREAMGLCEEGAVRQAFGLPPFGARLLIMLSCGRILHKNQIYNGLYLGACDRETAPGKAVEVQVYHLRRRLDGRHFRIQTVLGLGYRLAFGGERVRQVIEDARQTISAVPRARLGIDRALLELRARANDDACVVIEAGDLARSARLHSPVADTIQRLARSGAVTVLNRPRDRGPAGVWRLRLGAQAAKVAA